MFAFRQKMLAKIALALLFCVFVDGFRMPSSMPVLSSRQRRSCCSLKMSDEIKTVQAPKTGQSRGSVVIAGAGAMHAQRIMLALFLVPEPLSTIW
jgi:hypothetical protein